jgi:hypothetical protein
MLKAAENMWGKSALLYRVAGPPGHRLHIFLNSAYGQKLAVETPSVNDLCIDGLILQPLSLRAIKKGVRNRQDYVHKNQRSAAPFWSIIKGVISDRQVS